MEKSQELDETKIFKNEVAKLYNSLSAEQKKEVAMFYKANKEIFRAFKQEITTTYDAPTTLKTYIQSDCPKTDFKSFYSCTGDNLGNSINELGSSIKKIAEPIAYAAALGKLASATWYLGPSVWGLTAVGASLTIGTAMYILITEVRPAWVNFKTNLTPFLHANWIFAEATVDVITEEFSSETETDLNLDAKFRSIEETDSEVSSETSFFISSYGKLTSVWNDFSKVLGDIPSFTTSEESIRLETNDITISNISNSNVELVSQNGENAEFKSLSGNDEIFSFNIIVKKEGFTQTETVNASVSAVDPCADAQAPEIGLISHECTSSLNLKIKFSYYDPNGNSIADGWEPISGSAYSYMMPTLISGTESDGIYEYITYSQRCCCDYATEAQTVIVKNTCGIESNTLSFRL